MKKALFSLAVVGLMAASANAATLSLQWQGTAGNKVTLAPSGTAVIEVVVSGMITGDSLTTAFFSLEAIPGDPVTHVSNAAALANWNAGGAVALPFGTSQFAVGSPLPGGADDVLGPASVVIGSFVVHLGDDGSPAGTEYPVAFDPLGNNQLVKSDGAFWSFTANGTYATYSGYFTYGTGSPGVTQMMDSIARDTLIITKIPEPASLALLAMGGFAVIMRRRG